MTRDVNTSTGEQDGDDDAVEDRTNAAANLPRWKRVLRAVAWTAVIVSFPLWAAAFVVVPFLPFPAAQRGAIAAGCFVTAEVIFWAGALYLGADVIARFRGRR